MKILIKPLWLFWPTITLSACASNDLLWTEEVKLSDGQIIQVQRRTEISPHAGFPANRRGLYKSHEICYAPMNLRWKSAGEYPPDIFDIVDGKAYMHVPIYDCASCMFMGYPETDALYFIWEGEQWKRIKHEEFPSASEWNLLLDSQATRKEDDVKGFLSLASKIKDRDRTMHRAQQRFGWKRVNEGGKGIGQCNACRAIRISIDTSPTIFVNDKNNTCQK